MSLWSRITAPFRRGALSAQDAMRRDDPLRYMQILAHIAPSGIVVTMDSALELSTVWACVQAISNGVAACAWNVLAVQPNRREVLPNDPLSYILNTRPNPDMTAVAFREAMMFNALTWGNAYAEIVRDLAGRVTEVWPLLPHRMVPRRDFETGLLYFDYYQQDGGLVALEARQVFHLHGPGITGLMGDNLVARAAKAMGLAAAGERFASTYFGNNTILGGFLEYPKTMDDKTFKHVRDTWEDRFRGPDKSNKPAILEGGAKWVPINNHASDAQLVDSRKFQLEEICRWFGVPPHKVQHMDRATFNNIEHLAIEFVRDGLVPWTRRLEQEADYKLFPPRGPTRKTNLDVGPLTQGDFKSRAEGYQIMRRIGVYSANDILHKEGENTIGPEGDVRIVEKNMVTLDRLATQTGPEITPEHVAGAIATPNEAREQLGLPPVSGADELQEPKPAAAPPGKGATGSEESGSGAPGFAEGRKRDLIFEAAAALVASVLERYQQLATAPTNDRAEQRVRLRPWLVDEGRQAIDLVMKICDHNRPVAMRGQRQPYEVFLLVAADTIDYGQEPRAAAERMVTSLMRPPERLRLEATT